MSGLTAGQIVDVVEWCANSEDHDHWCHWMSF